MKNDRDRELLINGKTLTIRDEKYDFKSSELKEGEYTVKRLTAKCTGRNGGQNRRIQLYVL